MLSFKNVTTDAEIQLVSKLAYELFPLDYGDYVRKEHIDYFLDEYQSESAIKNQINEGFEYFLFLHDGEVMGYVGIEIADYKIELSKIYVCQDKRGLGMGEQAMNWLEIYAKDTGARTFELLVLEKNVKAIKFYKRLGFEVGEKFEHTFFTGYTEVNLRMVKELTEY